MSAELFFGLSRPGGFVSATEFERFLDTDVTPRFPEGLTVLDATGRWRTGSGRLVQERSKVVMIVTEPGAETERRLEAIRAAYRAVFGQELVGMTLTRSCASF